MKILKIIIFTLVISLFHQNYLLSDIPHFLDFKFILNQSDAGKKAQDQLKKKLNDGLSKLKKDEGSLREKEKEIIKQKKVISADEYKKKVTDLRSKVNKLQNDRKALFDNVAKMRSKAKNELLKNLNPIITEYMNEKKIRMVVDKKSLLLADESLDITKDIMKILNKKLKSIKLN